MASYIITGPDGKKYKVTGEGSKEDALAHIQQQQGGSGQTPQREGLLYKIPVVGRAIQTAEEAVEPYIGRPPDQQALNDFGRVGLDSYSFGLKDLAENSRAKTAAGFGIPEAGPDPDQQKLTREARERLGPVGAFGADVVGGIVSPGMPLKVMNATTRAGRIGLNALEGGAGNVANEWTHGERDPWALAKAGAVGSGASGAFSAVGDWIGGLRANRAGRKQVPTDESFAENARKGYDEVKNSGAYYHRDDKRALIAELTNMHIAPGVADTAEGIRRDALRTLQSGGDLDPDTLDILRQRIRKQATGKDWWDRQVVKDMTAGMEKWRDKTPLQGPSGADMSHIKKVQDQAIADTKIVKQVEELREAAPKPAGFLGLKGEKGPALSQNRMAELAKKNKKAGPNNRGYDAETQKAIEDYAAGKGKLQGAGEIARRLSPLRNLMGQVGTGVSLLGGSLHPGAALAIGGIEAIAGLGRHANKQEMEEILALAKTGKGVPFDEKTVDKYRQLLAKIGASGTRGGYNQNRGE